MAELQARFPLMYFHGGVESDEKCWCCEKRSTHVLGMNKVRVETEEIRLCNEHMAKWLQILETDWNLIREAVKRQSNKEGN